MSDGEDLLGKADALLSRYRSDPAREEPALPEFPVLTEVVDLTRESPSAPAEDLGILIDVPALDLELRQLEEDLRQRVLAAVQPYVASFLGEPLEIRIRAHIAPALDRLAAEIAAAAREEAHELVRKAVAEAVEREIAGLQERVKD